MPRDDEESACTVVAFEVEEPDGSVALAYRPATAEEPEARRQQRRQYPERYTDEQEALAADLSRVPARPRQAPILYSGEVRTLIILGLFVWGVIFLGGKHEWEHEVPKKCDDKCELCSGSRGFFRETSSNRGCEICKEGYINGGLQCFDDPSFLPPVSTAAGLGGSFYFVIIIMAQVTGICCQLALMTRLFRRQLLSKRESIILLTALGIEITRMLAIDLFMLRDYFNGLSYQVYRVPTNNTISSGLPMNLSDALSPPSAPSLFGLPLHGGGEYGSGYNYSDGNSPWWDPLTGNAPPDGYTGPPTTSRRLLEEEEEPLYYIATANTTFDPLRCSTFTSDSALLDYPREYGWATGGHPRFSRLGWVLGGEFAMYYFGATVINEVADNFFVVPADTIRWGWRCKAFSIVLEVFQLGALFPAAAFKHDDCLRYMDPLGVDLHLIRGTIVTFGYACWGSLVVIGLLSLAGFFFHILLQALFVGSAMVCEQRLGDFGRFWMKLISPCAYLHDRIFSETDDPCGPCLKIFCLYLAIASVPMFIAGSCLGVLVILGQGSKDSPQEITAAILLLLDVLFKIVASMCCECFACLLLGCPVTRARRPLLRWLDRMGIQPPPHQRRRHNGSRVAASQQQQQQTEEGSSNPYHARLRSRLDAAASDNGGAIEMTSTTAAVSSDAPAAAPAPAASTSSRAATPSGVQISPPPSAPSGIIGRPPAAAARVLPQAWGPASETIEA